MSACIPASEARVEDISKRWQDEGRVSPDDTTWMLAVIQRVLAERGVFRMFAEWEAFSPAARASYQDAMERIDAALAEADPC